MINWLKYKKIYFTVSAILIAVSIYSLVTWGLKLGVDFRGGTIIEYKFANQFSTEEVIKEIEEKGLEVTSVQQTGDDTYLFKLPPINTEDKITIEGVLLNVTNAEEETDVDELRFETVGPSVGPELIKKTVYAILIAAGAMLLWIAYQFKSFKFGVSAILAMFHDSFILIGSFAILGHFMSAEIDFLFVTALLTTLSFSVHDTIVVFDRIREIKKTQGGEMVDVANRALTETMVRSLNNSFTIAFMLMALLLLGGTTVKWFAAALLIGTILGTYSSPFVATPLLISWDGVGERIKSIKIMRK
ncbi:protein translocase subunit SecF [Patescibacteria group bacterium]|nr:protein translocase subunit SecF [Patescibacteria group bacterium]MBU0776844.1 protein translocase subunit SecF [Patescibacteria group bacterium]MBU0846217.1 protein translocase subunit SecF [Patescibacteria group bacterium]MBU0922624.1 protein translocase subunit SecF [Patescibacteria group bacterium]MBU1066675.1 protein translocase subunit SecF [Patescibacteria group bacterium]